MSRVRLAVEASTPVGGVAVGDGSVLLAEVMIGVQARHSASLLPAIDFALRHAGSRPRNVEAVVLGAGPGSFTGVRVAAATAKGLARALDVPILAASSLAALALAANVGEAPVCPLFDARRGQLYCACYRFGVDSVETLAPPRACAVEDAIAVARRFDAVCVGEGARAFADALHAAGIRTDEAAHLVPRPSLLLRLAGMSGGWQDVGAAEGWEPLYLRASAAERSSS